MVFLSVLAPTPTTTLVSSISTNYSSALTNSSAAYSRMGSVGYFYYEAIEVTTTLTGSYTFLSSSRMDTYGYLYFGSINASDLSSNLLTFNDDSGGNLQFLFTYTLQAGSTYIVVFTTFNETATGPFSLGVYGPSGVTLRQLSLTLAVSTTTSVPVTTSECFVRNYLTSPLRFICSSNNDHDQCQQYLHELLQ